MRNVISFNEFVKIVVELLDSVSSASEKSSQENEEFLKSTFQTIETRKGYVERSDAYLTGATMRAQLKAWEA